MAEEKEDEVDEFFRRFGDEPVSRVSDWGEYRDINIEELYQIFKKRLMKELVSVDSVPEYTAQYREHPLKERKQDGS